MEESNEKIDAADEKPILNEEDRSKETPQDVKKEPEPKHAIQNKTGQINLEKPKKEGAMSKAFEESLKSGDK